MEIGIFGGLVGDRNGKEMEQITWKRSIVKHSCKPKIYLKKYWICNLRFLKLTTAGNVNLNAGHIFEVPGT